MNYPKIKLVCYRLFIIIQYFLLKLIGLSPWSIDIFEIISGKGRVKNNNYKYCFSYIGTCYNFLLIAVIVVYNIWYLLYFLPTQSNCAWMNAFILPISAVSFIVIILTVFLYTIRGKVLINLIDRLRIVDKNLESCADYDTECDYSNELVFFVNLLFVGILTIMVVLWRWNFYHKIFTGFPIFLITWPLIHFIIFLNMVKLRFEGINSILSTLGTSKSKLLRSRELVLDDLASIKRAYVEICKACDDISSFYGIPVLIIIVVLSIRIVRVIYTVIVNVIKPTSYLTESIHLGILLQPILILIVLTTAVTKVMKQNQKTFRIINSLRDRFEMDEEIFEKVLKFSSHLTYLTVEITCCGIIPLSRSLLAIVSGTIVTYLIVAVQFYMTLSTN